MGMGYAISRNEGGSLVIGAYVAVAVVSTLPSLNLNLVWPSRRRVGGWERPGPDQRAPADVVR